MLLLELFYKHFECSAQTCKASLNMIGKFVHYFQEQKRPLGTVWQNRRNEESKWFGAQLACIYVAY